MRITELRKKVGSLDLYIEDLQIESGKIHGLVGPNGCGKTTLLKLIMGILPPDSGTIDLEGLAMEDITMMSQRPYLMHKNVYENIIFPLKIRKAPIEEEKIDALLRRTGLIDQKYQYAPSLSSGERQKEDGSTWLIISHQWDDMNSLFDKVNHMERGRIA